MRRLCAAILIVATASMWPVSSAAGGGWWSSVHLDERTVAPGQKVSIRSEVYWPTMKEAERAKDGSVAYHAFLMPPIDRKLERDLWDGDYEPGWWQAQPNQIDLGPLRFSEWSSNIAMASVRFEVPQLSEGRYVLMFCTVGCVRELGHMVPTEINVVASPAHANAANRADHLRSRLYEVRHRANREVRGLKRELRAERNRDSEVISQLGDLEEQVATMGASITPARQSEGTSWLWVAAPAALAGSVLTYLMMRRRTRPRSVGGDVERLGLDAMAPGDMDIADASDMWTEEITDKDLSKV